MYYIQKIKSDRVTGFYSENLQHHRHLVLRPGATASSVVVFCSQELHHRSSCSAARSYIIGRRVLQPGATSSVVEFCSQEPHHRSSCSAARSHIIGRRVLQPGATSSVVEFCSQEPHHRSSCSAARSHSATGRRELRPAVPTGSRRSRSPGLISVDGTSRLPLMRNRDWLHQQCGISSAPGNDSVTGAGVSREGHFCRNPSIVLKLETKGLKVTSKSPPMTGHGSCLQRQDHSAVTHPSSSYARLVLDLKNVRRLVIEKAPKVIALQRISTSRFRDLARTVNYLCNGAQVRGRGGGVDHTSSLRAADRLTTVWRSIAHSSWGGVGGGGEKSSTAIVSAEILPQARPSIPSVMFRSDIIFRSSLQQVAKHLFG
ncbi:hypothetical protein J6590_068600 [Homalodisca vitripennis]|nr:hypothetical protein J6590_068600 [Homalodisca vitripennis]